MKKFLMTAAFALTMGTAALGTSAVTATPANAQSFSISVGDRGYHRGGYYGHRYGYGHRHHRYGYYDRPYRYAGWRGRDRYCFWRHGERFCRWR